MLFKRPVIIFLFLISSVNAFAQTVIQTDDNLPDKFSADKFLGIKLRPEIWAIIKEIERKSGEEIYAEFVQLDEFQLGTSFISEDGVPVVRIDYKLETNPKKFEAVVAHELLHLRLRVNNYPTFLFSPTVNTAQGRAVDVEQSNINDLLSLIEHRAFKSEMDRLELNKLLNLAGDTARIANGKKSEAEGQADTLNYVRAILEYPNQPDVAEVARIYKENNWTQALASGKIIANLISQSNLQTPAAVEAVFFKSITELYPMPSTYTFKLTVDPENKFFRRMIISTARKTVRRKSR